jgi:DNA-binding LacI/PurR family transcriptional regulator
MIKVSSRSGPHLESPELAHLPRSPRLAQVVRTLAQQIRSGHFAHGQQLPTIRDLAQQHGLSFGSARSAVACLERAGLVESLQGSGTFVRHQPRWNAPDDKGAQTPWAIFFADERVHVGGTMPVTFARLLSNAGVMTCFGFWQAQMADHDLLEQLHLGSFDQSPRAIVLQGGDVRRDQIIQSFAQQRGIRVIALLRMAQTVPADWHTVNPDYYGAYQMAARELITRGHRRIGVVTKQRILSARWVHTVRKNLMLETRGPLAVGRALRDAGIRDGLSIHYNLRVNSDPSGLPHDETNVERMTQWLRGPRRPSAVITDDYRVPGLRMAARRAELRVPDDLAVISIACTLPPPLLETPAVTLRYDAMMQRAAELVLMDQALLGSSPRHIVVNAAWAHSPTR